MKFSCYDYFILLKQNLSLESIVPVVTKKNKNKNEKVIKFQALRYLIYI